MPATTCATATRTRARSASRRIVPEGKYSLPAIAQPRIRCAVTLEIAECEERWGGVSTVEFLLADLVQHVRKPRRPRIHERPDVPGDLFPLRPARMKPLMAGEAHRGKVRNYVITGIGPAES